MTTDAERIAELEAENARLRAGPVDYRDQSAPIADRIRAAEQAGDVQWSMHLKAEVARALMQQSQRVVDVAGAPQDFRKPGQDLSLREQITAAEEAGDYTAAGRLKWELQRALVDHRTRIDPMVERARELQALRHEEWAARDAAAQETLERANAARREQSDAIQRLPKAAREHAMHEAFGGPAPGSAA